MNPDVKQLEDRIKKLEERLDSRTMDFETAETIRDVVFFDSADSTVDASSTTVVTSVNFIAQTVNTTSISSATPAVYGRCYFKGKMYKAALFDI
jgi:hypothetical protein